MSNTNLVDIKTLATSLNTSIEDALDLAKKAQAVVKTGSKNWYDLKKSKEYQANNPSTDDIEWFGRLSTASKKMDDDVKITFDKNNRMRIRFTKECLGNPESPKRFIFGIKNNRMYFNFTGTTHGYALSSEKNSFSASITSTREDFKNFVGDYPLKRSSNGLYFIDKGDRQL